MPKELTAENGAKYALIGEFHENFTYPCQECGGDTGKEFEGDETDCHCCCNTGEISEPVNIEWTTIKDIHKKAVTLFSGHGNERNNLIQYLKQYMDTYAMGYDSSTHARLLINDLEAEEMEEREGE